MIHTMLERIKQFFRKCLDFLKATKDAVLHTDFAEAVRTTREVVVALPSFLDKMIVWAEVAEGVKQSTMNNPFGDSFVQNIIKNYPVEPDIA